LGIRDQMLRSHPSHRSRLTAAIAHHFVESDCGTTVAASGLAIKIYFV
jgi:hypothetical protein